MPHLIDEVASGAAASTSLRSSTRTSRRAGGCLSKKLSMDLPKSVREPYFEAVLAGALFIGFASVAVLAVLAAFARFAVLAVFAGLAVFALDVLRAVFAGCVRFGVAMAVVVTDRRYARHGRLGTSATHD